MKDPQLVLNILMTIGTLLAAGFSGWAAWSARAASKHASAAIQLEQQRDEERREMERTRQAKLIMVDLATGDVTSKDGTVVAVDCFLRVTNGSTEPVFKVRVRLRVSTTTWGPQLIGNLAGGQTWTLTVRVPVVGDIENTDAQVRFVDSRSAPWIASARNILTQAPQGDLDDWIAEGQEFAKRITMRPPAEHGIVHELGFIPYLENFREQLDLPLDGQA